MNKWTLLRLLLLVSLLLFSSSSLWAMDRYYLLSQARSTADMEDRTQATHYYLEYIDSHPAVTGKRTGTFKKNSQYYLRNLFIAFSNLAEIQRDLEDGEAVKQSLDRLNQIHLDNWLGSKNLFNLAKIYIENGAIEKALSCLATIIADQKNSPRKGNNKVFIRACNSLMKIYRSQERDSDIEALKFTLADSLGKLDLDLKDRYKIGRLLIEAGEREKGEAVLNDIALEAGREALESEENALIRTYVKLLKLNSANAQATSRLLANLDDISAGLELSPRNQHSLGIACLNAGQSTRGLRLLTHLKDSYPDTNYARKALFVLGRTAASSSDWDQAIQHYSEYIDRYPEPRFFSLKAYSRLIDCNWAKFKDPGLTETEARHLADIVNDIADFETELNLARDLKEKGFDELAEATLDLGMLDARNRLQETLEDEDRLRILWIIQKYAYPLKKFSLVEDFSLETLDLLGGPSKEKLRASEKARFFKSQTYIWLAHTYQKTGRAEDAIGTFTDFLTEFHDSRDANYVRFSLAEVYEEKGDLPRAKGLYEKIDAGVWKKRASKKLKKQGQTL